MRGFISDIAIYRGLSHVVLIIDAMGLHDSADHPLTATDIVNRRHSTVRLVDPRRGRRHQHLLPN